MRLFGVWLTVLATLGVVCNAQTSNGTTPAVDFSKIPPCGLVCLAQTAPISGCGFTDFGCICQSQKMIDLTTKCMLANCTIEDSFTLVRQQADICQYGNESKNAEVRTVVMTLAIITKFIIPLRLTLRLLSQGMLGWDDWLILVAFCTDTTAFYAAMKLINNGLGEHIWNIQPAQLDEFLLWSYVVLCMYVVSNGIIKLSVLAFYLRIFTIGTRFRLLCWINLVFCALTVFSFIFVTLFQCVPVSNSFKLLPQDGYCINYNAATWAHSALTVFQDTIVVILPVMEVIALQMSVRKKIGVILIFVLGGFVVVASIIRMFTLKNFGRTSDPTWTNQPTTVWSSIELGIGLICASIPSIYSGLRHAWPGFRTFTRRYISQNGSSNKHSNSNSSSQHSQSNSKQAHTRSQKARYRRESMDLPLTTMGSLEREMNSPTVSKDEVGKENERGKSDAMANLDKPYPPLPGYGGKGGIEALTTITVIREPRGPPYP